MFRWLFENDVKKRFFFEKKLFSLKWFPWISRMNFWQPCWKTLDTRPKSPNVIQKSTFFEEKRTPALQWCFDNTAEKISRKGHKFFAQCAKLALNFLEQNIFHDMCHMDMYYANLTNPVYFLCRNADFCGSICKIFFKEKTFWKKYCPQKNVPRDT